MVQSLDKCHEIAHHGHISQRNDINSDGGDPALFELGHDGPGVGTRGHQYRDAVVGIGFPDRRDALDDGGCLGVGLTVAKQPQGNWRGSTGRQARVGRI